MSYFNTMLLLASVLVLVGNCVGYIDIGKYFKLCERNSPDLNNCLVEAIQAGIGAMSNGIEELDVPSIDPYHQEEIRVDYKNNQVVVKMIMKDLYVAGLKIAKVHDARLKADEDNFYLEVDLTSPRVFIQGNYNMQGRFNSLRIDDSGRFNVTMTGLVYTWKLSGKPEKKDNETFVKIDSFYMRPDLESLKGYLHSNNPETRALAEVATNFANQNWRPLYRELVPYAQENWNQIGIRISNKIFQKVPFEQLFPL